MRTLLHRRLLGALVGLALSGCAPADSAFRAQDLAQFGLVEDLRALLQAQGVPPPDDAGYTALHVARDARVGRLLLEYGADVDAPAHDGTRPVHAALIMGRNDLLTVLIEAGASLDLPGGDGQYPLHLAAATRSPRALSLLLEAGADPAVRDAAGQTPQDVAARLGSRAVQAALTAAASRLE